MPIAASHSLNHLSMNDTVTIIKSKNDNYLKALANSDASYFLTHHPSDHLTVTDP